MIANSTDEKRSGGSGSLLVVIFYATATNWLPREFELRGLAAAAKPVGCA